MRILICEDSVLLREGLIRLLTEVGHEVVAALPDATDLHATLVVDAPDFCILDVRLPPTFTDEGIRAALQVREQYPELPVLVLSQYVEERYAGELIASNGGALGYLLKDRVTDVVEFLDALERIASGGVVLDPEVVAQLLTRRSHDSRLAALSERERQVLALIAEGRSNQAIAEMLYLSAASASRPGARRRRKEQAMTASHRTDRRSPLSRLLTVLGGIVILGLVLSAIMSAIRSSQVRDYDPEHLSSEGITHVKLDAPVGDVTINCSGTSDFTLTQQKVSEKWNLERDGDTVKVSRNSPFWPVQINLFGLFSQENEKVTLSIPEAACQQNLDADLKLSAGNLNADARFGALNMDMSAGDATLSGTASSITARLSAGNLTMNLDGTKQADLHMSAGNIKGSLSQVPEKLKIDSSAGSLELALPAGNYSVNSNVSAGHFDNQLTTDSQGTKSQVDIRMSAGDAKLTTKS